MKKRGILLVEDNPADVTLTLRALKQNKILNEIVVLGDGEQAINYIFCKEEYKERDPDDLPQLVLLDLKMPKVDGFEVLKAIRASKRTKNIPVAILTTSSEDKDRIESYNLGANSYIQKPVDFDQFAEAVRILGLYWLVLNVAP